ncbi:MAG: class I SAM-dependent methyltransferase [Sphingomonas sp.]
MHLEAMIRPRILSFGCATGQEAFTLARYLPQAEIDALDINPACIVRARQTARRRPEAAAITFACASAPDPAKEAFYDAILCLSVLRHSRLEAEVPDVCDDIMRFERFIAATVELDRALRPGGLLVLWGCHFRFADTALASRYLVRRVPGVRPQVPPFYGSDGRRLNIPFYQDFVFKKL